MRNFVSKFVRKAGLTIASVIVLSNAIFALSVAIAQPAGAICSTTDGSICPAPTSTNTGTTCPAGEVMQNGKCVVKTTKTTTTTTTTSTTLTCHHQTSTILTDVIYGGIGGGSNVSQLITSFQNDYNNGDGHYSDLKKVYNWGGASQSLVDGMNTSNTFMGYSHNDGTLHVIINGVDTVVGTNMKIAARWGESDTQNFTQIPSTGVCMHSYTRWFSTGRGTGPDVPTIVHIDQNTGEADFAFWRDCGNMITFTHVPLKPILNCVELDKSLNDDKTFTYTFNAIGYHKFVTIDNYFFDLGDGNTREVKVAVNAQNNATTTHSYKQTDVEQHITITVYVNKAGQHGTSGVTSGNCSQQIVIPPKGHLTFACRELDATLIDSSNGSRTYRFTGTTQGTDEAASYRFFFDSEHNTATQTSNTAEFTYSFNTSKANSFKAYFTSTSKTGLETDKTDSNCQFQFSTTLVRTGPASTFGLVALTSTLGYGVHQFFLRRKLS